MLPIYGQIELSCIIVLISISHTVVDQDPFWYVLHTDGMYYVLWQMEENAWRYFEI